MSAESRRRRNLVSMLAMVGSLLGATGAGAQADEEAPDLEFLEYLGSWEAAEEDWIIFSAGMDEPEETENKDNVEGSDPSPNGEKLAELEDES